MDNMVVTRREEILGQLDEANAAFAFPDLNYGYYYAIDVRLHAYGDDARWALIVETAGYNPRGFNVYDVLHVFGNCLIPADLPELLVLDQWHQPDLFEMPPSASEAYRQIADVLVHRDPGRYKPTLTPNTHWSNWPDSGSL